MSKNSIDICTSQHLYPANSFRDFPPERFDCGFGKRGFKYDFMARTLPYYKQEMEKGKFLWMGLPLGCSPSGFHFFVSTST